MFRFAIKIEAAVIAAFAAAVLVGVPCAFAADVEQLALAYTEALQGYEAALSEREQNADEIASIEEEIQATEGAIGRAQGELDETAVALYKGTHAGMPLVELLLGSESFQDAVMRYETYEKVKRCCRARIGELVDERDGLAGRRDRLEERRHAIEAKVDEAKRAADDAQAALLDATRADGAKYHQCQGNNRNCGATAFTVGVNILLHEKRFDDNVEVWAGAGFNGDSTNRLAQRGREWLKANGLGGEIGIEEVAGDVHDVAKMKSLLEAGNLVLASSGPDSTWQLANGKQAKAGSHQYGHWVVFYRYEDGIFFCNDSSAPAKKGAGCPYTEKQMQQWLDGRSYHSATILFKK